VSGGAFNYVQNTLHYYLDDVRKTAKLLDAEPLKDAYKARQLIELTALLMDVTREAMQRVDWFACGDDGLDNLLERWDKNLTPLLRDIHAKIGEMLEAKACEEKLEP
jgi:hypothetical protein